MCQHSIRKSPTAGMRNTQDQGNRRSNPYQQGQHSPRVKKTGHSGESHSPCLDVGRYSSNKSPKGRKGVSGQGLRQSSPLSSSFVSSGSRSSGSSPIKSLQNYTAADNGVSVVHGNTAGRSVKTTCSTPSRSSSPRDGKGSPARSPVPNLAYAGAKFSDPPSPKVLPKPPNHWFATGHQFPKHNCTEMSNVLKVMLKVQC